MVRETVASRTSDGPYNHRTGTGDMGHEYRQIIKSPSFFVLIIGILLVDSEVS